MFFFSCSDADENINEEISSEADLFLEKLDGTVWNHSIVDGYDWDLIGFDKDETKFITFKDDQEGYDFCLIFGIGEQFIDGNVTKISISKNDKNELIFIGEADNEITKYTFKIIEYTKIELILEFGSEKEGVYLYLKRGENNLTC